MGIPLGPRVIEVTPQENYILKLKFNNGEKRIFDVKPLLEYKVFHPLKNESFFFFLNIFSSHLQNVCTDSPS